jgi:hypothetical protein
MRVAVDIREEEVEGDYGPCDGLCVTCERCGYSVVVLGTEIGSSRYAATRLRDECPKSESNLYEVDWWG